MAYESSSQVISQIKPHMSRFVGKIKQNSNIEIRRVSKLRVRCDYLPCHPHSTEIHPISQMDYHCCKMGATIIFASASLVSISVGDEC